MIIREVRDRGDGVKQVTIPKDSDIAPGDYVRIERVLDDKERYREEALEALEQISEEEIRELLDVNRTSNGGDDR